MTKNKRHLPPDRTLVGSVELHCDGENWYMEVAVGATHDVSGPHRSVKAAFKHARHWTACQLAVEALKVGKP